MANASYFGFSGIRAAVGALFARSEGATQAEVNAFAISLTTQVGFYNMLNAANNWGHKVVCWDEPDRGRVFKLVYSPDHTATKATAPPDNWEAMNACSAHDQSSISEWKRTPRVK